REPELIRPRRCGHRVTGHEVRVQRIIIRIVDQCEMVVRECRVELTALSVYALAHGPAECRRRPMSDSHSRIGRDVGGIERTEGRREGSPTGQSISTGSGMTG